MDVSSARSEKVPRMIRWFSYRPAIPAASVEAFLPEASGSVGECLPCLPPPFFAAAFSSSRNGLAAPVNAAYIRLPRLHTSTAAVRFWFISTSGGRPCSCTFTP